MSAWGSAGCGPCGAEAPHLMKQPCLGQASMHSNTEAPLVWGLGPYMNVLNASSIGDIQPPRLQTSIITAVAEVA